jgi:hypothetical protein
MREHGLTMPNYNLSGDLQFITIYTLFDITKTGVLKMFNADISVFVDDADQLVRNRTEWDRSRNQQRNWETVMQIIGLRAQPIMLENPQKITDFSLSGLGFGESYGNSQTVWVTSFATDHADVYSTSTDPVGLLKTESTFVPMIMGLKESANITKSCIIAQGSDANTVFVINNTLPTQYVK